MTSTIELIGQQTHGDKAWKRSSGYRFASETSVIPLAAQEVGKAALALPLAFTRSQEKVSLVAVCGLHPQQNLFIAPDGRWVGSHVPSAFRGYPFKLIRTGSGDLSLCIDTASGLLVERDQGEPLFNDDGTPTEAVQQVLNFLVQTAKGQEAVAKAATALSQQGVLEPWPIKIKAGGEEQDVTGLLRVSEKVLNELEDDIFLELRKAGALPVAYAQMLSMSNIGVLEKLAKAHDAIKQRQEVNGAKQESMYGTDEDDEGIDWDNF